MEADISTLTLVISSVICLVIGDLTQRILRSQTSTAPSESSSSEQINTELADKSGNDLPESDDEAADAVSNNDHTTTSSVLSVCIRQDLGMTKGKMAAQASHGVLAAYVEAMEENPEALAVWMSEGSRIEVRRIEDKAEMARIEAEAADLGIPVSTIEDAGRTQIEAGSRTVVALGPCEDAVVLCVVGRCKRL